MYVYFAKYNMILVKYSEYGIIKIGEKEMNKILVEYNSYLQLITKLFICFLLLLVLSQYVSAQIVPEIRYNGRYRQYRQDVDGTAKLQFAVYDSETGGSILWESQVINNVRVSSGIFSASFSPQLTDKQWEQNLYLQVTIDDKRLSPREKLTYVPKSIYACNGVPTGAILIWSGSVNNIPDGWALCDGTNGTPDLRDRFVLGAGLSYSVNSIGGEKEHTLTIAEMPSHSHGIQDYYYIENSVGAALSGYINLSSNYWGSAHTDGNNNKLYYYSHTTENSGTGKEHNNMPPYYSLCYIMRIK